MFLKNAWYVACTPDEFASKPLGRQICGERMVFFRDGQGTVAALEDFCPHRGAPLSLGTVRDGHLVCGYHGLTMGADGKCTSMPCQRVGGIPAIRRYPAVERYGFVWVWPGDPARADPATIHPLHWADDPGWAYGGGLYHIDCDYRLMIDNLMDLTHETYVHASSIGQPEIEEAPPTTKVDGDTVTTSRFMEGIVPPPFWAAALRGNGLADDVRCDRWQICHFTPPSHVMIEVGVAHAGKGGYHADPRDAPHGRIRDQPLDDRRGVVRRVRDHVDDTVAEPRVVQHAADQPVYAGAAFGRLQHDRVAAGERHRKRARREDHGRIPRRDAEHDAARLAHGHREAARHVGRNHGAVDLRGHRGGLAQHVRREHHVEAVPVRHRARFRAADLDELAGARVHRVGRREQPAATFGRRERRPSGKRARGGRDRGIRIGERRGRRARGDLAGRRIDPVERRAVRRAARHAVDQQTHFVHFAVSAQFPPRSACAASPLSACTPAGRA
ncbi:hypothetical protein C6P92_15235 [Burkholderia multivorans]|nr:hypothetical protein C6P92_15235 [Burkholderia multivorans]PRG47245.1 hypothetical protein C6T62_03700 [Burkholderia multivorans]